MTIEGRPHVKLPFHQVTLLNDSIPNHQATSTFITDMIIGNINTIYLSLNYIYTSLLVVLIPTREVFKFLIHYRIV